MKINLPEKYADLYLKALTEKKQTLEAKIEDFKQEIREIDNHIRSLTSMPIFEENSQISPTPLPGDKYASEWSWTKKIAHFESLKGKLIIATEVVVFILDKEPGLDKGKVRSSVSAALSNWVRSKRYLKFKDPLSGNSYYGPTDWFLQDGRPQIDFIPEELKNRLLKR
ncbi:hypothetical protein FNH22_14720 [Fulvivirga sp. M361]|uniref:hypothetical protein n=1 Tax=Fulvivirga sp. M361 TaxID=2594266 RepID=UPI00117AE245|nr:hypothetical protein [Fulvivirga sp. M361]TRX57662.1 hypothetical protein FNH22_14720 [Fulvivirga sp. M361]